MISPFTVGTAIKIRLTKDGVTFEADAKVVLSQVGMGMGVAFAAGTPQQARIFQKWLDQLAGTALPETPSPESDVPEANQQEAPVEALEKERNYVLSELLIALMRKGILSDEEGKAMLQKLYR